jgi:hypothetical protein
MLEHVQQAVSEGRFQWMSTCEQGVVMRCQCTGESCEHHSPEQPCTNEAVPPIAVIHDPATNQPVRYSERGLCLACHAANRETLSDIT